MPPVVPFLPFIGLGIDVLGRQAASSAQGAAGRANAADIEEEGRVREEQQRFMDQRTMASARAMIGTSGVTSAGSPLLVLAESARRAEMNALNIRRSTLAQVEAQPGAGWAKRGEYLRRKVTLLTQKRELL